jgi:hypothetical protein
LSIVDAEKARFSVVNDSTLWWRDSVRSRQLAGGRTQWVLHIISAPPAEQMNSDKPGKMTPWRQGMVVSRVTDREPEAWALTAEPTTQAVRLTTRKAGKQFLVEVPEHRIWTTIVWTEGS